MLKVVPMTSELRWTSASPPFRIFKIFLLFCENCQGNAAHGEWSGKVIFKRQNCQHSILLVSFRFSSPNKPVWMGQLWVSVKFLSLICINGKKEASVKLGDVAHRYRFSDDESASGCTVTLSDSYALQKWVYIGVRLIVHFQTST